METKLIKIEDKFDNIELAKNIITSGGLVAFPTETVYGLGADGLNPEAVKKIFEVKGRPQDNPLILHISDFSMLEDLTSDDLDRARILAEKFWPGPLTMVLRRSKLVPDVITAGLETVAIRMPSNPIALDLIKKSERPIAAPSANISGRPSPTDAETCYDDLKGKVPLIIDGGKTRFGLESTVLDLSGESPVILRPGAITLEMLREIFPDVTVDSGIIKKDGVPKSPGQKYKHYAPKAEAYLLSGSDEDKLEKLLNYIKSSDKKLGLMLTSELANKLSQGNVSLIDLGSKDQLEEVASKIFRGLRILDKENVDIIICEEVENEGLGMAIMNRLKKSTSNRYL